MTVDVGVVLDGDGDGDEAATDPQFLAESPAVGRVHVAVAVKDHDNAYDNGRCEGGSALQCWE